MGERADKENTVLKKSKVFALRTIKLYQYLQEEKKEFVLSKQILRAGTSIGANLQEAKYGQSRRDFFAKAAIALKECAETDYWLELLYEAGYIDCEQYESVDADCKELLKLLTAITKTIKEGNF